MIENAGLIANLLGLIPAFMSAKKEKHYVKRSSVTINGLTLIIVGAACFLTNPSLYIFKIPLGVLLIAYGIVVVYMINTDWGKAQKIGKGSITLIILIITALIQGGLFLN